MDEAQRYSDDFSKKMRLNCCRRYSRSVTQLDYLILCLRLLYRVVSSELSLILTQTHIILLRYRELYRLALVDTPLAAYFCSSIKAEDLDELNIELIRNVLYKVKPHASTKLHLRHVLGILARFHDFL